MARNVTPRPIKATGARDAHGRILDPTSGSLYVHLHRENGLAHRHYVLRPWQVRFLSVFLSRPMFAVCFVALITWGWMAGQAARVPVLEQRIGELTKDAERLDTLTATLTELQARYTQVQQMLGAVKDTTHASSDSVKTAGAKTDTSRRLTSATARR
jgi:hypothetical protein